MAACRRRWPRSPCSRWPLSSARTTRSRPRWFVAAGPAGLVTGAPVFAALWLARRTAARAAGSPAFRGAPAAMRTSTGPLAALAPWIGVYGIGAGRRLGAALGAAPAHGRAAFGVALSRWRWSRAAASLVSRSRRPPGRGKAEGAGPVEVALLQGNIPQDEKFEGQTGVPLALALVRRAAARPAARAGGRARDRDPAAAAAAARRLPRGMADALPAGPPGPLVGMPWAASSRATRTPCIGFQPGGKPTASTSTTWCPSASSSRPGSAGSPT
jgi:apolipoprotein N-acyltransferase